ncbi:MAG: type VII toxin-antitoxin system HepT family RNase toxin [Spirochaetia bacterium]
MADKELVLWKIESITHCLKRIDEKIPKTVEKLKESYDLQDILSINLERTVQLSTDIGLHILSDDFQLRPSSMGEVFIALAEEKIISKSLGENLKKAVGFRNISVHAYQKIDWDIVYSIVTKHLKDFKDYIRSIVTFLK